MNRRNFLVGSAAVPLSPAAFGYSEKEKPLGFDLPEPSNLEELKVAVDEVSKHFHRRFRGKMGPRQPFTHKGNEYITFLNGSPYTLGTGHAVLSNSPARALQSYYWGIEEYASPDKQLVWRVWPEATILYPWKSNIWELFHKDRFLDVKRYTREVSEWEVIESIRTDMAYLGYPLDEVRVQPLRHFNYVSEVTKEKPVYKVRARLVFE